MKKKQKTPRRTRFAKKAAEYAKHKPTSILFGSGETKEIKQEEIYMDIGEYHSNFFLSDPEYYTFILLSKNPSERNRINKVVINSNDSIQEYPIKRYLIKTSKQKAIIKDAIDSLVNPEIPFDNGMVISLGNDELLYKLKIKDTDHPLQTFYSKVDLLLQ